MYDDLRRLLAGYFHEDFMDDHGSPDAALRHFAVDAPELAAGAVRDIDALLAEDVPEPRLRELIGELGSYYHIEADGHTAYGWLAHVRELLTAEIDRAAPFTVHIDRGDLDLTGNGPVTGPIWVRIGGTDFPEPGWPDFPVVLLTSWLSEFGTAADLGAYGPGVLTLTFMEGPYTLRLTRVEHPERWMVTPQRDGEDAGGTVEADEATILERLWHPALNLVAACRSYGWDDADIRHLATTVSALEPRVRG